MKIITCRGEELEVDGVVEENAPDTLYLSTEWINLVGNRMTTDICLIQKLDAEGQYFVVEECCDHYFSGVFTKQTLLEFANKLLALIGEAK